MGHAYDSVVYCALKEDGDELPQEGALRLLSADGSPSLDGKGRPEVFLEGAWAPICKSGLGPGSDAVICKSMGFSGVGASAATTCSSFEGSNHCGDVAPVLSDLACSGAESAVLSCPHQAGEDVFCAPSESLVLACAGDGETQGRPAKEPAPQTSLTGTISLALVQQK